MFLIILAIVIAVYCTRTVCFISTAVRDEFTGKYGDFWWLAAAIIIPLDNVKGAINGFNKKDKE